MRLWKLSDMMCDKLLKAVIPDYLENLGQREPVPVAVRHEVEGMSAATIDRRLRKVKAGGTAHRSRSTAGRSP